MTRKGLPLSTLVEVARRLSHFESCLKRLFAHEKGRSGQTSRTALGIRRGSDRFYFESPPGRSPALIISPNVLPVELFSLSVFFRASATNLSRASLSPFSSSNFSLFRILFRAWPYSLRSV